jgi:hypothetical protein
LSTGEPLATFDKEITMMKKIVLAASAAVAVLGAGTAALAASGSSSASPAASSSASSGSHSASSSHAGERGAGNGHRPKLRALGRALHAQWVTRDHDNANAFVTHDAIRGAVTAVSASSITVKAGDGVSQTYAVTSTTKVRLHKVPGKGGAAGTISDVHTGDKVAVIGTGTTSLAAGHILVRTK